MNIFQLLARQSILLSYPAYLDRLVNLVVNNEVELFQHDVSLHHQVGQLCVQLKLLGGDGRLV